MIVYPSTRPAFIPRNIQHKSWVFRTILYNEAQQWGAAAALIGSRYQWRDFLLSTSYLPEMARPYSGFSGPAVPAHCLL